MGVNSEGLQMAVLPVAIQGAIFQVKRYRGKFQGEIRAQGPIGGRWIHSTTFSLSVKETDRRLITAWAKNPDFDLTHHCE